MATMRDGYVDYAGYKTYYKIFGEQKDNGKLPLFVLHGGPGACHNYLLPYAEMADLYDRQRNVTINGYVRMIRDATKNPIVDITAANNRIASNFFHRLNTQRCSYLLGNGVSFTHKEKRVNDEGVEVRVDVTKEPDPA